MIRKNKDKVNYHNWSTRNNKKKNKNKKKKRKLISSKNRKKFNREINDLDRNQRRESRKEREIGFYILKT